MAQQNQPIKAAEFEREKSLRAGNDARRPSALGCDMPPPARLIVNIGGLMEIILPPPYPYPSKLGNCMEL